MGFFFSLVAKLSFRSIASGVALVLGASSLWFFTVTHSPFFAVLYALYSTNPFLYTHLHRRCFGTFTRTKGFGTHHPHKNHPSIKKGASKPQVTTTNSSTLQINPQTSKEPPRNKAKMPSRRPLVTALLGELTGTFLFLLFAFLGASITTTLPPTSSPPLLTLFFTSLAFALSLTANVWAFFRITGAAFNPAVTIALFVVTPHASRSWVRSTGVIVAQLVGGIAAAGVAAALVPGEGMPGVDTALGGGASVAQGFFIEVLLTAELVFVVLMVGVERHRGRFMAPAAVGTVFFLTQLVGEFALFLFFCGNGGWIGLTWWDRHQLHGGVAQPRAQSGAGGHQRTVAGVLLDLLCRAGGRWVAGQRVLCAVAVFEVGGVQPGPGLGRGGCGEARGGEAR